MRMVGLCVNTYTTVQVNVIVYTNKRMCNVHDVSLACDIILFRLNECPRLNVNCHSINARPSHH